jgi:AraC-like DNA-binding protein/mannose-6-phosphate isomerase-like protein (cupin superfamily)
MPESKKHFELKTDTFGPTPGGSHWPPGRSFRMFRPVRVPKQSCANQFTLITPQINADGIHVWPFDTSCPVEVLFLTEDARHHVPMNRHGYFEVVYLCSGSAVCYIQGKRLPLNEGDLVVIGSGLYHRIEGQTASPVTIAALFFEPDLIRCDGGDSLEYLTPFLFQDSKFPHLVPASTGVPREALEMMIRIRSEMPASSSRARLAVKTYLKMLLLLLVNHFASLGGTFVNFQTWQRALERVQPLFRHLTENYGAPIPVREAARICGMSESYFMSFFKRLTGLSFAKYLNRYRVERAQALLAFTDEPLASIGQEVGFCDQSYFGVVFRRLVGVTPAVYRQHAREECKDPLECPDLSPPSSRRWSPLVTSLLDVAGKEVLSPSEYVNIFLRPSQPRPRAAGRTS